jgi:glutamate dehydrogenase/leucine dehydrogenase
MPIIGPDKDIPAPDVYTDSQTMAWIMDTYSMAHGSNAPGVVTGKPTFLGGSFGRNEATARGCMFCVRAACDVLGISLDRATVAIQGFGNAGSIAARLAAEQGATIIAVSDSHGGIFNLAGLKIPELLDYKQKTGSVVGFPGAKPIPSEAVLGIECDILIPAALENQITLENVDMVKAKMVAEAANGPTTPGADIVLHKKGIMVIPDVLANAGGVTVSYFEWVQDLQELFWDEDDVNRRLERVMVRAFSDVLASARQHNVAMRTGAYILAIDRVAKAMVTRGIWP